jgi:integrase
MIFSNTRGQAVNRQSLHRSLAAALRAAGLPAEITFHQLRHTYSHLWPSSDDKTRRVLEAAFAAGHSLKAGRAWPFWELHRASLCLVRYDLLR